MLYIKILVVIISAVSAGLVLYGLIGFSRLVFIVFKFNNSSAKVISVDGTYNKKKLSINYKAEIIVKLQGDRGQPLCYIDSNVYVWEKGKIPASFPKKDEKVNIIVTPKITYIEKLLHANILKRILFGLNGVILLYIIIQLLPLYFF